MSINLQKGSKVDLTKGNAGVTKYTVALGWEENKSEGAAFDLDASAFILGADGKMLSDAHFIFYNNKNSPNDGLVHSGDSLTGAGDGDDESLLVDLANIGNDAESIVFVVTIHDAKERFQNFGQVRKSYIRIFKTDTNEEILKYELDEDFSIETAVEFGRLYKKNGEWKFDAVGTGMRGGLEDYLKQYQK